MRIPALAAKDYDLILVALTNAIAMFIESEGVTDSISLQMADTLIDSATEDHLSIQDILIFLRQLRAGHYGKFYGTPTVMQFMEFFEQYRQDRHTAYLQAKQEQHQQYKVSDRLPPDPPATRGEVLRRDEIDTMINQINKIYGTD
jgi:hypothetical protein